MNVKMNMNTGIEMDTDKDMDLETDTPMDKDTDMNVDMDVIMSLLTHSQANFEIGIWSKVCHCIPSETILVLKLNTLSILYGAVLHCTMTLK
jgi:hypothetical protein